MGFDTLIKNGTIIAGSNSPRFKGDIGISDGRIQLDKVRSTKE